ncbi:conserved protein of unknown function [Ruminococcaceae bacterium BL-6]|nr:conserved protein of unknown function [Ruminococcaceae bacterium BL-6]
MSSELVLYVVSACRRRVREVLLSYLCGEPVTGCGVRLIVCFEDGTVAEGAGHTIFGALNDLMTVSRTMPDYFGDWPALG